MLHNEFRAPKRPRFRFTAKNVQNGHFSWMTPIYCCKVIYKYSTEKALLLIMKMQERVFAPFAYSEQQYFLLNRG